MKKFSLGLAALLLGALTFTACSSSNDDNDNQVNNESNNTENTANNNDSTRTDSIGRTLVVYYSQNLPDGVDGTTGATDIVRENGSQYGANQYLAMLIARRTNADTLRITVERGHYPSTYNDLATFARSEADSNSHPALTSRTVDMADYDNVVISTPIWWYHLPMPVLSFLDRYDLSGKHVFVATTHAGSGLADAISIISREEPDAIVSNTGLSVRASSVSANTGSEVNEWVERIGL